MNQPSVGPPTDIHAGERSGLAVASLVLGICGIVLCLGPLAGIPAVICGHRAQTKIRESGGALGGAGLATAGLITGYISIAMILVIGLLAAIAIPNFIRARQQALNHACQSNLRAIQGAKDFWALEGRRPADAVPAEADLFGPTRPIHTAPVCPSGGRYSINSVQDRPACSIHGPSRIR